MESALKSYCPPPSMTYPRSARCTVAAALAIASWGTPTHGQRQEPKKPTLTVKVTPPSGFSPLRVRATADIRGGSNDDAEFYCATVEWDWGDGTMSENTSDCEPYQQGKSEIKRRFSSDHVFRLGGGYRIVLRLKQKTKAVATASAAIQVEAGAGGEFGR